MTAKERNRLKLLEYLSDPNNEWLDRVTLSTQVLGYKHKHTIYKVFTPDEIKEIELKALDFRRKQYVSHLAKVDIGLLKAAANGNPKAAKLVYQRFEGWVPKTGQKHTLSKDNLKEILEMLPESFKKDVMKKLEDYAGKIHIG